MLADDVVRARVAVLARIAIGQRQVTPATDLQAHATFFHRVAGRPARLPPSVVELALLAHLRADGRHESRIARPLRERAHEPAHARPRVSHRIAKSELAEVLPEREQDGLHL